MICRDCLIFQNRIEDLVKIWEHIPSAYVEYDMSNEEMSRELAGLWERKDRISLIGSEECTEGKCRLIGRGY